MLPSLIFTDTSPLSPRTQTAVSESVNSYWETNADRSTYFSVPSSSVTISLCVSRSKSKFTASFSSSVSIVLVDPS